VYLTEVKNSAKVDMAIQSDDVSHSAAITDSLTKANEQASELTERNENQAPNISTAADAINSAVTEIPDNAKGPTENANFYQSFIDEDSSGLSTSENELPSDDLKRQRRIR